MVRQKGPPVRSLPDIDYTNPSVVFWFFGQVPSKLRKNSTATDDKRKTDKKKGEIQRNPALLHPLGSRPDLPPLTDLQSKTNHTINSSHF